MGNVSDRWAAGSTYEDFMGRWSRLLMPEFLAWLNLPAGIHWLDVGCGTGALTDAVCRLAEPASVVGCDPSEPFVRYARENQGSGPASFVVAGVGSLPTRPGGFGSVTSSLALNFFPEPDLAVGEMVRISGTGGTVSACVWDYEDGMEPLRYFWDAVAALDPKAADLDEGLRFPVCRPQALEKLFRDAGLGDVSCGPIEIATEFTDFNEYWQPFLGGTGPAPSYVASLEEERRLTLAQEIERALPRRPDGAITLTARAWAVRGDAS
ncbi:MAG: methyltransferase domain-containing protein [Candidatus Krumholzibacteriota bacterium]